MPGGEQWVNVLHFGGIDVASTIAGAKSRVEALYSSIKSHLRPDWSVTEMRWRLVGPNEPATVTTPSTAIVGSSTSMPLPNDVAICVSWRTAKAGRSYRGRTYLGGWTQAALGTAPDGSANVAAPVRTAIATGAGSLASLTGEPKLVVWSPTLGQANEVVAASQGDRFDTQRRRENKLNEVRYNIPFL